MKLLTTIAAVLISISAYSQDLVEYDNGAFIRNGEQLSMEQIYDLTLLNKAGRGNFRRGMNFDSMHKYGDQRLTNNIVRLVGGAVAGYFGGSGVLVSVFLVADGIGPENAGPVAVLIGASTGLCVLSYKAFSSIASSPEECLRKRDRQFNKVAEKINQAIQLSNQ